MHRVESRPETALKHRAVFDVLGVRFALESNHERVLPPFVELLKRFQVADSVPAERVMRLVCEDVGGGSSIECDGQTYPLEGGEESLIAHAYSLLLHWVFGQVREFFLLHGSAVARGAEGLVISGQSGLGKTTLGCALAATEGWQLLSDDVAPLSIDDGSLHPFPKALSLRPGIASPEHLAAGIELPVLDGGVKRILSPEAMGIDVCPGPVRLNTLVFLEPKRQELDPRTAALAVVVHQGAPGLLERVRALPGVGRANLRHGKRFTQLDVETRVPARCLSQIEVICKELGCLMIGTARESQRAEPDFESVPMLEPLGLDQAVRLFLRHLWGTAQFRLVAEFGGGAGLYARVARGLSGVRCMRLRPGRYGETLALLHELAPGA